MKNKYTKIIVLFLSLLSTTIGFTQENSISPIFAITESGNALENKLASINQKTGKTLSIEEFASENLSGVNFTVSTLANSNVDKIYFLNSSNNLSIYELPYFFDPNYNAGKEELVISTNISDLDYHHNSSNIYAYDLASENLFSINPNSGATTTIIPISFTSTLEAFSIETTKDFVILNGEESGNLSLLLHNINTNTQSNISVPAEYVSLEIVANHHLTNFYGLATDEDDKNWLLEINPSTETIHTVGQLPSCTECSTESFTFDKNALALDWENNQLLTILKHTTTNTSEYNLITFNLTTAKKIYSSSLNKKYSNLYFNKVSSDLVFPGDTNHDGIVNSKDLFSIGLKYSFNTIARFSQTANWIGQHSFNTGVIKQGVDVKHADCNGDGIIDQEDIQAIKENYSYIHNSNKSAARTSSSCDFPLAFSFPNNAYENNEVTVFIKLGESDSPVPPVYGVDFTVEYNKDFVVPGTMKTTAFNSWFGTDGNNFNRVDFDDHPNGKIDINITGNDLLNRAGGGDILTLSWTMEDDVVPSIDLQTAFTLRFANITIINLAEEVLESCGSDTSLVVYHKDAIGVSITSINNDEIEIYPNPAKTFINIKSNNEKLEFVEMYSITGKLVKSVEITQEASINISSLAKGVYYIKIHTTDNAYMDKIIVD